MSLSMIVSANIGAGGTARGLRQSLESAERQIAALSEVNAQLRRRLRDQRTETQRAWAQAAYDELTGLPNRRLLADRLRQTLARAERGRQAFAILLIDVNGFKGINDTLGHAAGDRLLCVIGERLAACVRANDTVCRYGGDEFVVLLPDVESTAALAAVRAKIGAGMAQPVELAGRKLAVTLAIGAARYPGHGAGIDELLAAADRAMYRDKKAGRPM